MENKNTYLVIRNLLGCTNSERLAEEKLMEYKQKFYSKLGAVKQKTVNAKKDNEVSFTYKNNPDKKVKYSYVDLAQVTDIVKHAIAETNIYYSVGLIPCENDEYLYLTIADAETGYSELVILQKFIIVNSLLDGNVYQQRGSAQTYLIRYMICMAFGIAYEDDDAQIFNQPVINYNKPVVENKAKISESDKLILQEVLKNAKDILEIDNDLIQELNLSDEDKKVVEKSRISTLIKKIEHELSTGDINEKDKTLYFLRNNLYKKIIHEIGVNLSQSSLKSIEG